MPRPQPFSEFLLARLRTKVVEEFGKPVSTKADCDHLSELIEQRTGKLISVNTLRRIFDVMSSDSKPSLDTLNVLSAFCKFYSFYDFEKTFQRDSFFTDLNINSVNELYASIGDHRHFFTTLNWLVRLAFHEKNHLFLKPFFDLDIFKNYKDYTCEEIHEPITSLSIGLRENPDMQGLLLPIFAANERAQSLYFEYFVDYDYLPSRHHAAILEYAKYKTDDEAQLFSQCLLFFRSFLLTDQVGCILAIKKINALKWSESMHPFPTARRLACNLLFQSCFSRRVDNELVNEIFEIEKQVPRTGILYREEPIYHLAMAEAFTWCGLYDESKHIIELAFDSYSLQPAGHSRANFSRLWMYYSAALNKVGKTDEARLAIQHTNTDHFSLNTMNFDLMNYHKILFSLEKSVNLKVAHSSQRLANEIAARHEFKFFQRGAR